MSYSQPDTKKQTPEKAEKRRYRVSMTQRKREREKMKPRLTEAEKRLREMLRWEILYYSGFDMVPDEVVKWWDEHGDAYMAVRDMLDEGSITALRLHGARIFMAEGAKLTGIPESSLYWKLDQAIKQVVEALYEP